MSEHPAATPVPTPAPNQQAAQQAASVVELLEILFERARHDAPPLNLPISQLRVLYLVDRENGIRMRALTHLLGAGAPSVCRLVDRLQALGFVERHRHPGNRREVVLHLTRDGDRHLAQVRGRREDLLLQAIDAMPAKQRRALTDSLTAFHAALTGQPSLNLVRPAPAPAASTATEAAPDRVQNSA